jgi:hypothetical protein
LSQIGSGVLNILGGGIESIGEGVAGVTALIGELLGGGFAVTWLKS